jgi:hypothetical protein
MKASIIRRVCLLAALVAIVGFWVTAHRAAADGPAAPVVEQSLAVDVDQAAPAGIPAAVTDGADVWSASSMACGDRRCNGGLECCWYQVCRRGRCVAP